MSKAGFLISVFLVAIVGMGTKFDANAGLRFNFFALGADSSPLQTKKAVFKKACRSAFKFLSPTRDSNPKVFGDRLPFKEKLSVDAAANLLIRHAKECFDHGLYFNDEDALKHFNRRVEAYAEFENKAKRAPKAVADKLRPFDPAQIPQLLKDHQGVEKASADEVSIRDLLLYFNSDAADLDAGLEGIPKRIVKKPVRLLGFAGKWLAIGAFLAIGAGTYDAILGSLVSSYKEISAAEGRMSSYNSLSAMLLEYNPHKDLTNQTEKRKQFRQIYLGANSTWSDPEQIGRDFVLWIDDFVGSQSAALQLAAQQGNSGEVWLVLERFYFIQGVAPEVFNHPYGQMTLARMQYLSRIYDPSGEIKKIVESGKFSEAWMLRFGPEAFGSTSSVGEHLK